MLFLYVSIKTKKQQHLIHFSYLNFFVCRLYTGACEALSLRGMSVVRHSLFHYFLVNHFEQNFSFSAAAKCINHHDFGIKKSHWFSDIFLNLVKCTGTWKKSMHLWITNRGNEALYIIQSLAVESIYEKSIYIYEEEPVTSAQVMDHGGQFNHNSETQLHQDDEKEKTHEEMYVTKDHMTIAHCSWFSIPTQFSHHSYTVKHIEYYTFQHYKIIPMW